MTQTELRITRQRLTPEGLSLASQILASRDHHLGSIYKSHGVPPMWGRPPGFETLLRIVLEQQVSLVSARSMFARLNSNIQPFTPEGFINIGEARLRSLGSRKEVEHIHTILQRGTSAEEQLRVYRETNDLTAVVDRLMELTMEHVPRDVNMSIGKSARAPSTIAK